MIAQKGLDKEVASSLTFLPKNKRTLHLFGEKNILAGTKRKEMQRKTFSVIKRKSSFQLSLSLSVLIIHKLAPKYPIISLLI